MTHHTHTSLKANIQQVLAWYFLEKKKKEENPHLMIIGST